MHDLFGSTMLLRVHWFSNNGKNSSVTNLWTQALYTLIHSFDTISCMSVLRAIIPLFLGVQSFAFW